MNGECKGHPAGEFDQMGQTVYCDGSCNPKKLTPEEQAARLRKNAARRAKHAAYTDLGLKRVRGSQGGVYYE